MGWRVSDKNIESEYYWKWRNSALSRILCWECLPERCRFWVSSGGICLSFLGGRAEETSSLLTLSKATGEDWANKFSFKVRECSCCLMASPQPLTTFSGCCTNPQIFFLSRDIFLSWVRLNWAFGLLFALWVWGFVCLLVLKWLLHHQQQPSIARNKWNKWRFEH